MNDSDKSKKMFLHLADEAWFTKVDHGSFKFITLQDAAMLVDGCGKIKKIGPRLELLNNLGDLDVCKIDHEGGCLVPGFVDAHLHYPQLHVMGSGGHALLDWLDKYVFPAEAAFGTRSAARIGAQAISRELKRNGVTTAAIFSSVHGLAADELFNEFDTSGLRLVSGKTSMDKGAPRDLLQQVQEDFAEQKQLISKWHGKNDRLFYALTPRFALSCTREMFRSLSELYELFPTCFVQTHISENKTEVQMVREAWKDHKDYLAVYEDYGLLGDQTLLAHGIYLSEDELARVGKNGATIVHCPTSNTFLGSGLFPMEKSVGMGVNVCLGSDIGAGTSLSPFHTMLEVYKVQALQGSYLRADELLYYATLAGAKALKMDSICGSLEEGKSADFVVLSAKRNELLTERLFKANSAEERLFAFITLGDDRVVEATYVAGQEVYRYL
jgi:guanine deaminase